MKNENKTLRAAPRIMRVMRLRYFGASDFRKSGETNYAELVKERKSLTELSDKDIIVLRSRTGRKFRTLCGFTAEMGKTRQGKARVVFEMAEFSLGHGTWSDDMIADYVEMRGIKLEGIMTMREIYRRIKQDAERVTPIRKPKGALKTDKVAA